MAFQETFGPGADTVRMLNNATPTWCMSQTALETVSIYLSVCLCILPLSLFLSLSLSLSLCHSISLSVSVHLIFCTTAEAARPLADLWSTVPFWIFFYGVSFRTKSRDLATHAT